MKTTIHALAIMLLNAFALQLLISHVRRREELLIDNKYDSQKGRIEMANNRHASRSASFRRQNEYGDSSSTKRELIIRHKALLPTELLQEEVDNNSISSRDGLVKVSEEDESNSIVGFFPKGFAIFSGIGRGEEIDSEETETEEEGFFPEEASDLGDGDQISFEFLDPSVIVSETEEEEVNTADTSPENDSIVDRPQAFLPIFVDDTSEEQYLNLFQPDDIPNEPTEDKDLFQPIYNLESDPDNAQDYSEIFLSVFGTPSPNQSPAPTMSPSGGSSPGPSPEPSSQILGTPMPTLRSSSTNSVAPTESLPLFTLAPSTVDAPTLRPVLDGQTLQPTLQNAPTLRPVTPTLRPTLFDAPTVRPTVTSRPTESTPLFTLMPTAGTTTVPSSQTTTTPGAPTMAPTTSNAPAGDARPSSTPSISGSVTSAAPTVISASNSSSAPTGVGTDTLQPSTGNATQSSSSSSPTLSATSLESAPPSTADNSTGLPTLPPTSTTAPSLSSPPSIAPSISPAPTSTLSPSTLPSTAPSLAGSPSAAPSTTVAPSGSPIVPESLEPTGAPSIAVSSPPTVMPTNAPTAGPTGVPTAAPTTAPTLVPSPVPSPGPTASPTAAPTPFPTPQPTSSPVASVSRRDVQLQQFTFPSSSTGNTIFAAYIILGMTAFVLLI